MSSRANIDSIVTFLTKYNLDEYNQLSKSRLHQANITGGGDNQGIDDEEIIYRLSLTKAGLNNITQPSQDAFNKAKEKLRKLSNWQLIGQIIVLVSGATILGTIQAEFAENWGYFKLVAPSLVLIGSIITLVHKTKSEALIGGESLSVLIGKLLSFNTSSKMLLIDIDILEKFPNKEKAIAVIDEGNKLIKDLTDTIEKIS